MFKKELKNKSIIGEIKKLKPKLVIVHLTVALGATRRDRSI